jgi:toxin FitB
VIILGTNVVSEAMKPSVDLAVTAWLDAQLADTVYLSSITLAELLFGISSLPSGRRRDVLNALLDELLVAFEERVLPFDTAAARAYADLATKARAAGRGLPIPDAYIAAIVTAHGFMVATRDTAPFEAAGVPVINPWAIG